MSDARWDGAPVVERVAEWCGIILSAEMHQQLARYEAWLRDEAIPAGGLGPREGDRVNRRHIADSVAFGRAFASAVPPSLVDLGSGVGLPGIPLAVVLPDTSVTLLDRSGRRVDLASRAVRILGLENVRVVQGDLRPDAERYAAAVMRAVLPTTEAIPAVRGWLEPDGIGVLGLHHGAGSPDAVPADERVSVEEIPADVLDSPGWLLTIRP